LFPSVTALLAGTGNRGGWCGRIMLWLGLVLGVSVGSL
jgi:hypothetical protein